MKRRLELRPVDIERYRSGNTGVDFVHVLDSGHPGPNVLVQALTHGNELCGAIALDWWFREGLVPRRGKLTLIFANVAAYARFDPDDPDRARYVDEDLNRVWADEVLFGPRQSAELARARALRPFVDAADYVLDLHSMHEPCRPIMVCAKSEKSVALARRIGVPADLLLDTGHPAGLRMIERGGFGDPASPRTAVLIECGQHWEKAAADVAIDTMLRFLRVTGTLGDADVEPRLRLAPAAEQRVIRVTEAVVAQSPAFRFAAPFRGLEVLPKKGTLVATDGATVWRTPYDDCVLVMPSLRHLKPGTTMVRLGSYGTAIASAPDVLEEPSMDRKDKVEGEGSYTGSKDYNERTKKFVDSGKVDEAAREAKPRSEQEAHEMQKAERVGKQRGKGEDPALQDPSQIPDDPNHPRK